jgi:hypothetical protein
MYKVIYQVYLWNGRNSVSEDRDVEFTTFDEACSHASKCKGAVYAPNGLRVLKYH